MTNLNQAEVGIEYKIVDVNTDDEDIKSFLFTLGCYSGEPITIVSRKKSNMVISVKDARYNIDQELASTILI